MKKIKKFIRYFFTNPYYTMTYAVVKYSDKYICKANLIEDRVLLEKIQSGTSLIRFGDGDIYIAHGGNQSYQVSSKSLRSNLFSIFKSSFSKDYISGDAKYLIGLPSRYIRLSNRKLKSEGILQCWLPFKIAFKHYFNTRATYFDSHLFYQTGAFEKYIIPALRDKNVLFVSNQENIDLIKEKSHTFLFKAMYLNTSSENSFKECGMLMEEIKKYKQQYSDLRVILATGTTSKVIAFKLSSKGITCYDIGWGIQYTEGENVLEQQLI